jgi:hypothetical protein
MVEDHGIDELVRQWTADRSQDAELTAASQLASEWLAESTFATTPQAPVLSPVLRGVGEPGLRRSYAQEVAGCTGGPARGCGELLAARRRHRRGREVVGRRAQPAGPARPRLPGGGPFPGRPCPAPRPVHRAGTPSPGQLGGLVCGTAAAAATRRRRLSSGRVGSARQPRSI